MFERKGYILIRVAVLLSGQLNIQADTLGFAPVSALIGCFHYAGAAAADNGKAGIR